MLLLLAQFAHAIPAIEEGPWIVNVCVDNAGLCNAGTLLGEIWATSPGTGASWVEVAERTGDWSWVTSTTAWLVSVPATAGSLSCGNPACQRVGVTTTDTFRPKPTYGEIPISGSQSYLEWHPVGKYEVTAYIGVATKVGYYYVAEGANNTRTERLCTPSGFKWPGRNDGGGDIAVTWRVKLVSAGTAPEACPALWKKTEFTVSLAP